MVPLVQVGFDRTAHRPELLAEAERAVGAGGVARLLAAGVRALVEVVTCHRVELYMEGVEPLRARRLAQLWLGEGLARFAVVRSGEDAARHLLRVAAGLESAVLGEDQILGQLRSAYSAACAAGLKGPVLHKLFHAAFRVGKRVRGETELAMGGRSVAGCAVLEACRFFGSLEGVSALILGAGDVARVAGGRLRKRGVSRLMVCNRSLERGRVLAEELGAEVVPWRWRSEAARLVDLLVVCTAADGEVMSVAELEEAARFHLKLALDLSMPPNLPAPGAVRGLEVVDVAKLDAMLEDVRRRREGEVAKAQRIVEEELEGWMEWLRRREAFTALGRGGRKSRILAG